MGCLIHPQIISSLEIRVPGSAQNKSSAYLWGYGILGSISTDRQSPNIEYGSWDHRYQSDWWPAKLFSHGRTCFHFRSEPSVFFKKIKKKKQLIFWVSWMFFVAT